MTARQLGTLFTTNIKLDLQYGTIQVLRSADGGGGVSDFLGKSITKVYSSTLLALRGGGWGSNFQEKRVT